ncbi:helix-turn-helix domain-containing protein [Actinokineospora sp.]|uniref:helix-turn-helix domain-containing protein n=1 Tax=Actinokineospora sp. TaxID=1872133 RepID=UPI0040383A32
MASRDAPSALQWLIGVELKRYRDRSGLTQPQVVKAVGAGLTVGKLGHLETGERRQYPEDIARVMAACGAERHEIGRLTSLAELADSSTWWGSWSDVVPDWFGTFVGLERLAAGEFTFEPLVIPGLVQTPAYAQSLTMRGRRVRPDHSNRLVELRMQRARRLTDPDNPLTLHFALTDHALGLHVGAPEVMVEQYNHLITLAKLPNITMQVVVPERGPHDAPTGQFTVLDFEHARSIAYVELQDGAIYAAGAGEVDTYRESTRSLADVALPPEDSIDFVIELIKNV